MLSISLNKLTKQRKIQIIVAAVVFVILLSSTIAFFVARSVKQSAKKATNSSQTQSKDKKPTATTDDVQSDLNSINDKSTGLDSEIDGTNSGLSDQQADLTY